MSEAPSSPDCGLCHRPIRDGEPTEELTTYVGGEARPGCAHAIPCPDVLLVWCPPCLRAVLTGEPGPHGCHLRTSLGIDGARVVVVPEAECLCPCPGSEEAEMVPESAALKAARTEAREGACDAR